MEDEDGNWIDPSIAIDNITDEDGLYDIDKAVDYLTTNGRNYKKVFKDVDGDELKLTDFKKTQEFGSSGSGRLIREFESVQCVFIAIKQYCPDRLLNSDNFKESYMKYMEDVKLLQYNNVHLSENIKINLELINDFLKDENWIKTFYEIPNKLWEFKDIEDRFIIDRKITYSIYHVANKDIDSPYVNLYNKYKELSTKEKFTDINIAKWCPADVYLISMEDHYDIINSIKNINTIVDLNNLMDSYFNQSKLLPLSLKKISGDFNIIINGEKNREMPEFHIKTFIIGSGMKGIGSKISTWSEWKHKDDEDVDVKDRKMNFDSSDTSKNQDVDGEVEGSSSRHGKISFKAIQRIITNVANKDGFNISGISTHQELKSKSIDKLKELVLFLVEEVKELDNDRRSSGRNDVISILPISRGSDITVLKNKLISRIQSLQIILSILEIYNIDEKVADETITKMFRYALSIENDKFKSPMYLRII